MTSPSKVIIRELASKEDWALLQPLVKELNNDMTKSMFAKRLKDMRGNGYRCVGAFKGEKLIGAVGFWVNTRFWCGKYIDLDNAVVSKAFRGKEVGAKMVSWIEKTGKKEGCELAVLDSYTTGHKAHRFYFRQGYSILGYHFTKDL